MNRNRTILTIACMLLIPTGIWAQNDRDAFRYSFLSPTGSARYTSLAGSMGAFGADFSTASSNPAALGTYNKSELSFSPSLYFGNTAMEYNGEAFKDFKGNFNFGNIGMVLTIPNSNGDWKAVQFSTGVNRLANFNQYTYATGSNDRATSIADQFALMANRSGFSMDENGDYQGGSMLGYAAYQLYLIDRGSNAQYIGHTSSLDLLQEKSNHNKGSMNEYVLSLSGNYDDVLYIGGTLGIPFFNYVESSTYMETNQQKSEDGFSSLQYGNYLHSEGVGINFKFGMLYQPFHFLRVGFALHTPTFYSVDENYDSHLYAVGDSIGGKDYITSNGEYEYRLTTPYRVLGNAAFFFGNYGFINVDYEFADYGFMRMRADDYSFRKENMDIQNIYRGTHTIRIGGEINLSPMAVRAGFAHTTNPYVAETERDGSMNVFSAGLGWRGQFNYIDFAYMFQQTKDRDVFYAASPYYYENTISKHNFVLTFGWKF